MPMPEFNETSSGSRGPRESSPSDHRTIRAVFKTIERYDEVEDETDLLISELRHLGL
jgi:hypothetical protein